MAEPGEPGRRSWRVVRVLVRAAGALLLVLPALLLLPLTRPEPPVRVVRAVGQDSVTLAVGPRYRRGAVGRLLFGSHYRELWTLPVRVAVLDLDSTAGGLVALREGGGEQTWTLHFGSASGRRFVFRSADKEARFLWRPLRRSLVARLVEDQTSSAHPAAALVAEPLQAALGLPAPATRFIVLPPGLRLGGFQERFAGLPGIFQERLATAAEDSAGLLLETAELLARLDRGSASRLDAPGYLTARLLDFVLQDWDRHPGQWRWRAAPDGGDTLWRPVPLDRDQAFSWYDGLLLPAARLFKPQLAPFGPRYPRLEALTRSAKPLDARVLAGLDARSWDSVAGFVTERLSPATIAAAVARLPEGYRRVSGALLAETLTRRRDGLRQLAAEFRARIARTAPGDTRSEP